MADRLLNQYLENVARGADFDDGANVSPLPDPLPVRLIAFFLPQFHAIPENDEWWGRGFTEWTNVSKTLPRFSGHYQPRLPGAFGFYDLSNANILRRQAETARRYGIEGFCFHHYWFGGRRLLERPLEILLADRSIDLPFCVNWANENWTRRWDGQESQVLMAQAHSPEDDIAFARSLEPLFDDPRYIRVGGRPLLLLYRPAILPDARATVDRWRQHFATKGEDPLILMPQVFDDYDPRPYEMDGAIGFPPFGAGTKSERVFPSILFDPEFRSAVLPYDQVALKALEYRPEEFRYFPGVCPSWDNSPRTGRVGKLLHGSTPIKWSAWLEAAARQSMTTQPVGERLVFINAWNEWAEGAYLEPDRHFGFAYLAETARCLGRLAETPEARANLAPFQSRDALRGSSLPARIFKRAAHKGAQLAEALARKLSSV